MDEIGAAIPHHQYLGGARDGERGVHPPAKATDVSPVACVEHADPRGVAIDHKETPTTAFTVCKGAERDVARVMQLKFSY